jgi:hypothetical protein
MEYSHLVDWRDGSCLKKIKREPCNGGQWERTSLGDLTSWMVYSLHGVCSCQVWLTRNFWSSIPSAVSEQTRCLSLQAEVQSISVATSREHSYKRKMVHVVLISVSKFWNFKFYDFLCVHCCIILRINLIITK